MARRQLVVADHGVDQAQDAFEEADLLSGTFRNPAGFAGDCGFAAPADRRMLAMLAFADVNAGEYGRDSRGVAPQRG